MNEAEQRSQQEDECNLRFLNGEWIEMKDWADLLDVNKDYDVIACTRAAMLERPFVRVVEKDNHRVRRNGERKHSFGGTVRCWVSKVPGGEG